MATAVRFQTRASSFHGVLDDTPLADAMVQALPISSTVRRWGEEIYFDVPVKVPNERPTMSVKVGDLAYWPEGPCVCIFFGRTPASVGKEPRPASEVTIVGQTNAPAELLRAIKAGTTITVDHAGSTQDPTV